MKPNKLFPAEIDAEADVRAVAEKIQPLPSTVTPSARFIRQTRQRLSRLTSQKIHVSRKAA